MLHRHRELRQRTHLIRIPVGSDSRTGLHSVICMCVGVCVCVCVCVSLCTKMFIYKERSNALSRPRWGFFFGFFSSKIKGKTFWSCSPHQTQLHQMCFTKVLWWISYFRSAVHFGGLNVYKMIAAHFFFFPLWEKIPTKKKDYVMTCTNGQQLDIKMLLLMVE